MVVMDSRVSISMDSSTSVSLSEMVWVTAAPLEVIVPMHSSRFCATALIALSCLLLISPVILVPSVWILFSSVARSVAMLLVNVVVSSLALSVHFFRKLLNSRFSVELLESWSWTKLLIRVPISFSSAASTDASIVTLRLSVKIF